MAFCSSASSSSCSTTKPYIEKSSTDELNSQHLYWHPREFVSVVLSTSDYQLSPCVLLANAIYYIVGFVFSDTVIMGDKNAQLNAKMVQYCPELASEYAKYPLAYKAWLDPKGTGPKGVPCFITAPQGSEMKLDYAHGAGPRGWGYYHILTRPAYVILYSRLTQEMPCCCCASGNKKVSDWDDVKTVVYNRSVATKPDDAQARKDAIAKAQGVAQAHYHTDQNFQLIVGHLPGL
jgi:hypothetical protein